MKQLKFMFLMLFACIGMASCDELTEEEQEPREPIITDYLSFKVNKCERIGSVLIVDFTATNKTQGTLRNIFFESVYREHIDNLGNKYYGPGISLTGGAYSTSKTFSLQKGESVNGRLRIKDFDPTNKATRINISLTTNIESEGLRSSITFTDCRITDNRIIANGFQTPDDNLEVTWVRSSRDKDKKEVYITFNVTNTSDENITNLYLSTTYNSATDNTGNVCRSMQLKVGNGNYQGSITRTIAAGETVTYVLKIPTVENNATAISGRIGIDCNNYTLCDDHIYFFDIPLQSAQ